ncbi:YrrS family protein [Geobacillus sp. YF-1]|uniref:YrrS family protein n=1 Tax=Geobacillus sp. YF-1 TaxID=3457480 RepID=UPI0040455CE2
MAQTETRFAARAKRRKMNRWLNGAIAVVLLLIVMVAWNLLFGGKADQQAAGKTKRTEVETGAAVVSNEEKKPAAGSDTAGGENEETAETKEEESTKVTETPGPPGSNIEKEIVNPAWQPVGTTQSEPHETVFDENSVDWKEMLDAVSYATGIAPEEMIVWFIGNNGPNKAVATISTKGQTAHYRVYIEWVTNEGWKPTKVQKLKQRPS